MSICKSKPIYYPKDSFSLKTTVSENTSAVCVYYLRYITWKFLVVPSGFFHQRCLVLGGVYLPRGACKKYV